MKGDLFEDSDPRSSLAHCVSSDFKCGKGIATVFIKKFFGLRNLRGTNVQIGSVAVLKDGRRFIYNLITKETYKDRPTYKDLSHALIEMKHHAVNHGVQKISMPKIGCGLDQLEWQTVKNIIHSAFIGTNIKIFVFYLEQNCSAGKIICACFSEF